MRPETDIAALVREGMELKTRMQADRARLREIADRLAGLAVFRPNSATGWVITAGCRARVQVRRTVTWDQERLAAAREAAGPEAFDRVFAAEYRPVSIRACRAWLEDDSVGAEAKALVRAACLVGEGRAYLSSAEFPGDGAERCAGTEAEADAAAPGALPEVPHEIHSEARPEVHPVVRPEARPETLADAPDDTPPAAPVRSTGETMQAGFDPVAGTPEAGSRAASSAEWSPDELDSVPDPQPLEVVEEFSPEDVAWAPEGADEEPEWLPAAEPEGIDALPDEEDADDAETDPDDMDGDGPRPR